MRKHSTTQILAGVLLLGSTSRAEVSPLVLAESLFQEGKRLMQAGDLEQACPKLAESFRIDPVGGTLLALALCHERQGKTATAWAEYRQALAQAQKNQRAEREKVARERIEALEKVLSRVRLVAPPGAPFAMEVKLDSVLMPSAVWGTPLPVDPGDHSLSAGAPGFQEATLKIQVPPGPSQIEVPLPQLIPSAPSAVPVASVAPSAPVLASSPPPVLSAPEQGARGPDSTPRHSTLVLGLGTAGGVVVLGSVLLGAYAWSQSSHARELCPGSPCQDQRALDANLRSDRAATGANVAFGVGVVALGSAAVLWWLDRDKAVASSPPGVFRF